MKFNKRILSTMILATSIACVANAGNMYINLGDNSYDRGVNQDADFITHTFNEFTLGQLLATSVYQVASGDNIGVGTLFTDINTATDLANAGIPASGLSTTALDGSTALDFDHGFVSNRQVEGLQPVTGNSEGFSGSLGLGSWTLDVAYVLDGIITTNGPEYVGGTFSVFFRDLVDSTNDFLGFEGALINSAFTGGNLDLWFEITAAEDDFLFIQEDNSNSFIDVADIVADPSLQNPVIKFDTNINPPEPSLAQLAQIGQTQVRQTTLDSSFTVNDVSVVPEPSAFGIIGAGLLALFGLRRRAKG